MAWLMSTTVNLNIDTKKAKPVRPDAFMPLADGPLAPARPDPDAPKRKVMSRDSERGLRAFIDKQVKAARRRELKPQPPRQPKPKRGR